MISLLDIRSRLNVSSDAETRVVDPIRKAVIADFENATGRLWEYRTGYVWRQTLEEYQIRDGIFRLPLAPIVSLSISEYGEDDTASAAVVVPADEYEFNAETGRVRRITNEFEPNIVATITGGYNTSTTRAPSSVIEACVQQVLFLYQRQQGGSVAASSKTSGQASVSLLPPGRHPMFVEAIAANRRRFV